MAGSFEEAAAQIRSLIPGALTIKAGILRRFHVQAIDAGGRLRSSAQEVGGQHGAPYAAYRERLAPTADWLQGVANPAGEAAAALESSAQAGQQAQMVLAQQEELLARYAVSLSGPNAGAQLAAAMAQALVVLNKAIDAVSATYRAVEPGTPAPAPVRAGSGAAAGAVAGAAVGAAAGGAGSAPSPAAVPGAAGLAAGGPVTAEEAVIGPTSGPFAGFVQDPTTGNLVDPATGREVDPAGRFLDPITGQPFGDAGQFASRLEGISGGTGAAGGLLGGAGGVGVAGLGAAGAAGLGAAGVGGPGVGGAAGGGLAPFFAPGGLGAVAGGSGGARGFAGLYGGVVPPSLTGTNPASAQLHQQAAQRLETSAAVAQRYSAIASGQTQGAYLPPMAGGGMGAGAAGGSRPSPRSGRSTVTEPATVWGALGRGRGDGRSSTAEVEDDDIWTGGGTTGSGLLDGR